MRAISPERALAKRFEAALKTLRETGEPAEVEGVAISWPRKQPSYYAIRRVIHRPVRCRWTGEVSFVESVGGGSIETIAATARSLAYEVIRVRETYAQLMANPRPGILTGPGATNA